MTVERRDKAYSVRWEAHVAGVQDWRANLKRSLWLALLTGFIAGAGMSLYQLSDFSILPDWIGFVCALVAGVLIGALTHEFDASLTAFLLALAVTAAVHTLSLILPELGVNRLGLELVSQLSVSQALINTVLALPLILVGVLVGKVFEHSLTH